MIKRQQAAQAKAEQERDKEKKIAQDLECLEETWKEEDETQKMEAEDEASKSLKSTRQKPWVDLLGLFSSDEVSDQTEQTPSFPKEEVEETSATSKVNYWDVCMRVCFPGAD